MKAGHWCGIAIASLQLLVAPATARADGFRCGQWVVQIGDTTGTVRTRCGEPVSQDRRRDRRGGTTIETWVYNFGAKMFMQEAIFENGRLVKTEQLGYGQ